MLDRKRLPDLDPLTREAVAEWIEYQGQMLLKRLPESTALLESHPEYTHLTRHEHWMRCASSFANMLAYQVRTAKTKKLTSPPVQVR